jgi:hypothetical protein
MFDSDDFNEDESIPFEDLIKKYDMIPLVNITIDDDGILVSEKWHSEDYEHITAERFYYFDIFFMEYLPNNVKVKALNEILNIYVDMEMFEEAIIVRDEIKNVV